MESTPKKISIKTPSKTDQATLAGISQMVNEIVHEVFSVLGLGFKEVWSFICREPAVAVTIMAGAVILSCLAVLGNWHLQLLYWLDPETFTLERLHWLLQFSATSHFTVLGSLTSAIVLLCWALLTAKGSFLYRGIHPRALATKHRCLTAYADSGLDGEW